MKFDRSSRGARPGVLALGGVLAALVAGIVFAAFDGVAGAQAQAVPTNTAEPVISGTSSIGSTLTGSTGTWANSPTSFSFQWVRCSSSGGAPDGSDCATISGATTTSYVVGSGDAGFTLRLRVTGSNSDGSQTVASNATGVVAASTSPVNTQQPVVTGDPVQGRTLTGTNGTWTGTAPITYAYQWVRCPSDGGAADGSNCGAIAAATSTSYTLQAADVGFRIRLRVSATNGGGTQTAASNATGGITATSTSGVPTNTKQPVISGTAAQGAQLTASVGAWAGAAPITYTIQWVRCNSDGGNADASNCPIIVGATAASYVVQAQDAGARLRIRVTAKNSLGSSLVASNATAAVTGSTPLPTQSGVVPIASVVSPNRLMIDRAQFTPNPVRSRQATIQLRVHVSDSSGRGVSGALVFARTTPILTTTPPEQATGQDGWATLTLVPRPTFPLQPGRSVQTFIRARKGGEPILGGVSIRRLVQVRTAR